MRQKIIDFIHTHPRRAVVVAFITILFLLLSEKSLYPTLSTSRVRQGQTLDYFLHKTFDGSHNFAYAALYRIRITAPQSFSPDYLQANYGFQKNGYGISIKKGDLSIVGPNDSMVLDRLPILPQRLMSLYYRQTVFYNIFLAMSCLVFAFVAVRAPVVGLLKLGKKIALTIVIMPVLLPALVPALFFIALIILSFATSFFG